MKEIKNRVKHVPCTVKCRLGVDDFDSYEFVKDFISEVSKDGYVDHFVMHARKAFLKGLNPSQNRNVPPLWYDRVYKLQEDFPNLRFTLNGGIKTIDQAQSLLTEHGLEGCMIGRTAYENPYELAKVDSVIYGKNIDQPLVSRESVLLKYADYLDKVQNLEYFNEVGPSGNEEVDELLGVNINSIKHHYVNPSVLIKPIINMYHGVKFSTPYRQLLSTPKRLKEEPLSDLIKEAIQIMTKKKKDVKGE